MRSQWLYFLPLADLTSIFFCAINSHMRTASLRSEAKRNSVVAFILARKSLPRVMPRRMCNDAVQHALLVYESNFETN